MATTKHKGLGRGLDDLIAGGLGTSESAPAAKAPAKTAVRPAATATAAKEKAGSDKRATDKPSAKKGSGKPSAAATAEPQKVVPSPAPAPAPAKPEGTSYRKVQLIALSSISKCPWQPRQHFGEAELSELAASIRERGILQPVLLRVVGDGYELIAGERRLRAAEAAGLKEIPALVQEATDDEVMELALIENIQRQDLNPIEEAKGYSILLARFGSQDEVARRVGKARPSVANALRLLELSDGIKQAIVAGRLSAGHAKVLLGAPEPLREKLAERVIRQGLSVRALEAIVNPEKKKPVPGAEKPAAEPRTDTSADQQLKFLAEKIQQELGTKVTLFAARSLPNGRREMGRIIIEFFDGEDLSRLLETLNLSGLD